MSTLDHKRIGVMYLFTTLLFFLVGGIFALLVRTELWSPRTIMSADSYNQAFSYHGTIMVFMVIIPMIPAAIGNFVLPMQLGAKDVAFPRLNLASYWVWLTGAAIAASTMALKGLDTGWTLYTPISISSRANTNDLGSPGCFCYGFRWYFYSD